MSLFDWFADRRKGQYVANVKQEPDEGDGLWSKCPECGQVVYLKDLKLNASVCANCGYHHRIDSAERIGLIADPDSFQVLNADLAPVDPLGFKDRRAYADRLRERSGLDRTAGWGGHWALPGGRHPHGTGRDGFSLYGGIDGVRGRGENHPSD